MKTTSIGIIGLSVHSEDFTRIINGTAGKNGREGCVVTQLFHPPGNTDVEFSTAQLEKFSKTIREHGVSFAGSIEEMLPHVDAVMLLTNDGRPHLKEVLPVLKARKPVYIDKPLAESLENVTAIFREAEKYGVPVFTSSALRYVKRAQQFARGETVGKVLGAETWGPAPLQQSHVDLFWDGIHGVELLYTVMGPGCQSVSRVFTPGGDIVTGVWPGGRTGVFRGLRKGRIGFGGTVFGTEGIEAIGGFDGYEGLVDAIQEFFRSGKPPVSAEESIEIYTFMKGADISKSKGGMLVKLADVPAQK